MRRMAFLLTMILFIMLCGCSDKGQVMDGGGMMNSYRQISQEEAKKMMETDDGHVIVDVRRQDEYDAGHIPGAILIPNESIGDTQPEELPDLNQIILIYCRSGNRSKQAAQKLFDMGYTNIYEFGGIIDWTGEVVTEDSITESTDTEETEEMMANAVKPTASLVMEVNGRIFYPHLADNSSAEAFFEKMKEGELVVALHDYGNFEKVGLLPWDLPRNDEKITTVPGDIILYQGNQITIYYDENTWEFTRLAKIHDVSKDELLDVFGEGDVTVSFWLEWSE